VPDRIANQDDDDRQCCAAMARQGGADAAPSSGGSSARVVDEDVLWRPRRPSTGVAAHPWTLMEPFIYGVMIQIYGNVLNDFFSL